MPIEPAISAAVEHGHVPANITVEYLMENRDPPALAAIIFIAILTVVVVGIRCYSRVSIAKSVELDDWLALLSTFMFIAFVILSIVLIKLGSGRHIEYIQYVLSESQTNWTETLDFAAHLIYTSALYVSRMSGLAFYSRICQHHDVLNVAVRGGAVFLTAAYLPSLLLIIFHCTPVTSLWPYAWQPKAAIYTCISWGTVYVTNSGLSLACDMVIFTIPVFLIKYLNVSRKQKMKLSAVLLPGVLVIIISIVRLYLVVKGQWLVDGSWFYSPMLAIETAEIGGTIIALSVPGLKPLFSKLSGRFCTLCTSASNSSIPKPLDTIGRISNRRKKADPSQLTELDVNDVLETTKGGQLSTIDSIRQVDSDSNLETSTQTTIP